MEGESVRSRRLRLAALSITALLAAAACGDDGDEARTATPDTTAGADAEAPSLGGDDHWASVVDAAADEGTVTIYSSQPLDPLNDLAAAFEAEYPDIDVEVVRGTDGELATRVETERQTGFTVDMWVTSSQGAIDPKGAEGEWFVAPAGPSFQVDGYEQSYFHQGDYFEVGAAILTFGWNTEQVPDGLTDYTDLLDPELAGGRIAVIDANCCPAAVDFYHYLEETYGEDFVEQLAEQEPRIYPSALPIGEALGSGEVAAAAFTLPLVEQREAGAPVDFAIAERAWGTRFFGAILDGAPHPNAAQLLADFMVSEAGQAILAANQSAVLPDVPGALTSNSEVREQDLASLTPELVAEYQARWNELFQ